MPVRQELFGAIDIVDAPRNHVGADVDLQVVRAFQGLPRTVGYVDRLPAAVCVMPPHS